nr:MAG TPA: hypothetical protein [Caudoviricetes sp.]
MRDNNKKGEYCDSPFLFVSYSESISFKSS